MSLFTKLKESAKAVPYPVYIAGMIIPGGLCAIAIYLAWKASKKEEKKQTLREFIDEMVAEEEKK